MTGPVEKRNHKFSILSQQQMCIDAVAKLHGKNNKKLRLGVNMKIRRMMRSDLSELFK